MFHGVTDCRDLDIAQTVVLKRGYAARLPKLGLPVPILQSRRAVPDGFDSSGSGLSGSGQEAPTWRGPEQARDRDDVPVLSSRPLSNSNGLGRFPSCS